MTSPAPCLIALLAGQIDPHFGPEPSAIAKVPVAGPVAITRMGLAGDQQANLVHHGGPDKALHHYPAEHYAFWREAHGARAMFDGPGGFGENVSTEGLSEQTACLGDRFRLGTALVEVSHGRQPCAKLDHRAGLRGLSALVVKNARCGWYYRVLEEGVAEAGDACELVERPLPQWSVARLFGVVIGGKGSAAELRELAGQPLLAEVWRKRAAELGA